MAIRSLIINPGSTSTKIAVFEDETMLFDKTLRHSVEEISKYDTIFDQKQFRKDIIMECLKEQDFDIKTLDMVVGRGGLVKPIPGGTYKVSDALIEDLKVGPQGQHASNLGGVLAREIADEIGKPSFIVDPVAVDELQPVARVSGIPDIQRNSIFHPLNQKAMARRYAKENGKRYEDINVIVAHMGGGVSVGAHKKGRVIDVSNALEGDGAFSPERAGGLPVGPLVRLCYSGKYTEKEMYKRLVGGGGFTAYLGSNDMVEITKKSETDEQARLILDAFIYQVAKDIGSRAAVLEGKVDAIILTGGIAYGKRVTDAIEKYVGWIAPVIVYPGEDELLALAQGGLRVLNGEEEAKDY
ncbi:MAG: butyrate kinase [Lachnospiraceae bacterium]|nr:butyrate kinase [Lachnospiraceae bacterium]